MTHPTAGSRCHCKSYSGLFMLPTLRYLARSPILIVAEFAIYSVTLEIGW